MKKLKVEYFLLILGIILFLGIFFLLLSNLSEVYFKRNEQAHSEKGRANYSLRI
jgi:uncharacterized integral membrane protein